jgi:hypothetical protein
MATIVASDTHATFFSISLGGWAITAINPVAAYNPQLPTTQMI